MSLYRLIRLAKKTGDRLIVHNELDETDVVIMDLDNYEKLLRLDDNDGIDIEDIPFGGPTPDPFDSPYRGSTYPWEEDNNVFDDEDDDVCFEEEEDSWERVGDVMESRYPEFDRTSFLDDTENEDVLPPEEPNSFDANNDVLPSDFGADTQPASSGVNNIFGAPLPVNNPAPTIEPIQMSEQSPVTPTWKEESLPDEPVFYEEPV